MQEKVRSSESPKLVSGGKVDAYNIKEVAKLSSYSQGSVNIHRQRNYFPNAYKMGNRWMIPRKDFMIHYGFDPEGQYSREDIVKMIEARTNSKEVGPEAKVINKDRFDSEGRMIEVAGELDPE